jgi:hypothetical protein
MIFTYIYLTFTSHVRRCWHFFKALWGKPYPLIVGGLIAILPAAWRDWTGRVNVTFDFPRVTPDYGSLGQGDAWSIWWAEKDQLNGWKMSIHRKFNDVPFNVATFIRGFPSLPHLMIFISLMKKMC